MRIAVLIIALCLSCAVGLQSCAIFSGSNLIQDEELAQGGALGVVVALLFVLGAAFAMGLPRVAAASFALAGLLGLAAGRSTEFDDLSIWGVVALALALMSWFGSRELRKKESPPRPEVAPFQAASAANARSAGNEVDLTAQLERISRLKSDGSISDAEFQTLKARLLS